MEAALIIPLFLLSMMMCIQITMSLYKEVIEETQYDSDYWAVEEFYKLRQAELIWEVIKDDKS